MNPALLEANWRVTTQTALPVYKWAEDEHLKKYTSKWVAKFPGKDLKKAPPTSSPHRPLAFRINVLIDIERLLSARRLFNQIPGYDVQPKEVPCAICGGPVFIPAAHIAIIGYPDTATYRSFVFSLRLTCHESYLAISRDDSAAEALQLLAADPMRTGPSELSLLSFIVVCLIRTADLPVIRQLRCKFDTWAASRIQSTSGTHTWYDPSDFLKEVTQADTSMRTVRRNTLSMANGRDLFPAILLATLPRIQQVHLHRGMPDCVFFMHACATKNLKKVM
jgi:hypothetical protein